MQAPIEPLAHKLAGTRRYQKMILILAGIAWVLTVTLVIALLCYHVDKMLALSSGARVLWRTFTLIMGLLSILLLCVWAGYRRISDAHIATHVEQTFPELKERLLTSIDLIPALASPNGMTTSGFSPTLAKRLVEETRQQVQPLDFRRAISRRPFQRAFTATIVLVGVLFLDRALSAEAFDNWVKRMMNPYADIAPWADTRVWITPDKNLVPVGEGVQVTITTRGKRADHAVLLYRSIKENDWKRLELKNPAAVADSEKGSALRFVHRFPALAQTILLSATANDGTANEQRVTVEDRPTLLGFRMILHFPTYMHRPEQIVPAPADNAKEGVTSDGNILAPVGTQIDITATANKNLEKVELFRDKKPAGDWTINKEKTQGHLGIVKNGTYALHLTDRHGFQNQDTTQYEIRAVPDQTPLVQITQPTSDLDLVPTGSLPLVARATDDYGITRMGLHYTRVREDNSGEKSTLKDVQQGDMALPGADGSPVSNASVRWELGSVRPLPGETLQFEVTATDNDTLNGPHIGRSSLYRVHIISLPEMQRRLKEQMDEEARALQQLRQKQIDVQKELQRSRINPNASKMTQTQEAQKNLAQEAQSINQRLNELTTRLENNHLATPSEVARRDQASKLLENLATTRMPKIAEKIQQAQNNGARPAEKSENLQQADQEQTASRQDIEKAQQLLQGAPNTEQIAKDLERLAKDQQMLADGSRSIAEDMQGTRRQTNKKQLTEDQKASMDIERRQQADINKETKALQENLKRLAQAAKERGQKPQAEALERATNSLQQGKVDAHQSQALQDLNKNNPADAASPQDRSASALNKALESVKEALQDMQNRGLKDTAESLERAAQRLNELSNQQKEISKQIGQKPDAATMAKLAQQEKQLQAEANKIASSLSAAPQAQQSLQSAQQSLSQSGQQLSQNQSQKAQQPAQNAQKQLQEAAKQAQRAAQQIRQQQASNEMAQKVEEILQIQRALLSATQRIHNTRQKQKLNPTELRELGQVASRQRSNEQRAKDTAADFPSPGFKRALELAAGQLDPATKNLNQDQPNTGAETQDSQRRAIQSLEIIAQALKQQAKGNESSNNGEQKEQNGEPTPQNAQQYAALGDLMLAQGMQKQIRQDTGKVDTARAKNPKSELNENQQKQAGQLADTQGETQSITENAGQQLNELPGVGETIRRATDQMSQSRTGLNQKETGRPTQQHQEMAATHLDQAIQKAQEQLEQQRQQQQAQNMGSQPGMPQPNMPPGNDPKKNPFTRLQAVQRGFAKAPDSTKGKGFSDLNMRDQRVLREGQQERVPAEYQDIVTRYYRSLATKKK